MKSIKTITLVGVAACALVVLAPGIAHAGTKPFPPPAQAPVVVSCDLVTVDPPEPTTVTLLGTIDGKDVDLTVPEADVHGHEAEFGISAFTTGDGVLNYDLTSTWSLGEGEGPHAVGSITCHEPPTTTTTAPATTTTTTTQPTTTSISPTPTTVITPATPAELPFTGSTTAPLAIMGGLFVLIGAVILGLRRR